MRSGEVLQKTETEKLPCGLITFLVGLLVNRGTAPRKKLRDAPFEVVIVAIATGPHTAAAHESTVAAA